MNFRNYLKSTNISTYNSRQLILVFIIIYSALIIDLGLSKITNVIPDELTSNSVVASFVLITSICTFGQYYLFIKVRSKFKESKFRPSYIELQDFIIGAVNYALIFINVIVIFQVIFSSSYNIVLLLINGTLSYGLAAFLMGLLSKRFLSWFMTKKSIVVLLYGLATAAISINAVITIVYFDSTILNKSYADGGGKPLEIIQSKINPNTTLGIRANYTSYEIPGPVGQITLDVVTHSVDAYFILTWIATAILLLYNAKRIGRIKYWTLVSLTLIYFFSYYFSPIDLFQPASSSQSTQVVIFFLLFYTYSITIGGLLFGIGFWLLSKSIKIENKIRDFMQIVAFSFLLFFNVGEATIHQTSFPPFGLANVSFVGISAYLMLAGLSFSALSISKDIELRKYIRNLVIENSNLLGDIGVAEVEADLRNKVRFITKKKEELFEKEPNVGLSLSDEEIKQYIDDVIKEVKKSDMNLPRK